MQGTFRWKAILVSFLLLAVFGTGWFFLHRYQKRRLNDHFLELAARDEEKQPNRAARFLRQYLLVKPDDVEVLERYGKLLEKHASNRQSLNDALNVYERLLEVDKDRKDIRLRAGKLCMLVGNVDGAVTHFKELNEASNAEVEHLWGECELARFQRAKKDEKAKHQQDAEKHLTKAIELAPNNLEAYVSLARLLAIMARRDDGKFASEPHGPISVLDKLVKANANEPRAYLIRAELRQSANFLDDGYAWLIRNMVTPCVSRSVLEPLVYAQAFTLEHELLCGAAQDIARAEELVFSEKELPKEKVKLAIDLQLISANQEMLIAQKKEQKLRATHYDNARTHLHQARKLDENDTRILSRLAALELAAGERKSAILYLAQAHDKAKNRLEKSRLLWDIAMMQLDNRELQSGKDYPPPAKILSQLTEAGENKGRLDFLDGRILMNNEEWSQAVVKLEAARANLLDSIPMMVQTDLLLARCFERLGDTDRQLAAYNRAIAKDNENMLAGLGKARALALIGKTTEAIQECRSLRSKPRPFIDADLLYVRLLILKNLAEQKTERRSWTDAETALEQMEAVYRDVGPEVKMARAEFEFARGKPEKAKQIIEDDVLDLKNLPKDETKRADPKKLEAWLALASLSEPREEALKVLATVEKIYQDPVEARIAKFRYVPKDAKEAAAFLAPLGQNLNKYEKSGKLRLLVSLASAHEQLGDTAAAKKFWQQLEADYANDLRVQLAVFDYYLRSGDVKAVNESAKKIQATVSEYQKQEAHLGLMAKVQAKLNEITTDVRPADGGQKALNADQKRDLDQVREDLRMLAVQRPGWSRVPLVLAAIADLQGDDDAVIKHLGDSIGMGNRQVSIVKTYLYKLQAKGRIPEAEQEYQKLKESGKIADVDLQLQGAEISVFNRNLDRGLDLARMAVPETSKNAIEYLKQGELLALLGKADEARNAFKKAREFAPDDTGPWLALIRLEARYGDAKAAEKEFNLMAEAIKSFPPAKADFARAHGLLILGKVDESEKAFRSAMADKNIDLPMLRMVVESLARFYIATNRPKDAEPVLRMLLDQKMQASAELQFWSRRHLAIALWFQEDPGKQKESRNLLNENLAKNSNSVEDILAHAMLLATSPATRDEAIQEFTRSANKRVLTADQVLVLAQLYDAKSSDEKAKNNKAEAQANWQKARDLMMQLLSKEEANPKYRIYLVRFVDMLTEHGEFAEADLFRSRFNNSLQESVNAILRGDKVVPGLSDGDRCARACAGLAEAARRYPQLAKQILAQNESTLKTLALKSGSKEALLAYADFLGAAKGLDAALDLCEGLLKELPTKDVVAVAVGALGNAKVDQKQQFERVEKWIAAGRQQKPDVAEWDFFQAVVNERQQKYAEAEANYRAVLKREAENISAINNLAFLIGQRGKADEALTLVDKAIAKIGSNADLLDTKAVILRALGKSADAEKVIQDALRQERSAYRLYHLSQIYESSGNLKQADEFFRDAQLLGLSEGVLHPLEMPDFDMRKKRVNPNPKN